MSDFEAFSTAVFTQFNFLSKKSLYIVGTDNRQLEEIYLAAFPEGTNPLYKTKTKHDCNCCKQFLRNIGNVVALSEGKIQTVWEVPGLPHPYDKVAKTLHDFVASQPVTNVFSTKEPSYGAAKSRQLLEDKSVKTWNHFHGKVPTTCLSQTPDAVKGAYRTRVQVFQRGLEELKPEAVSDVLDLINTNAVYRAAEHKALVVAFQKAQKTYTPLAEKDKNLFVWENAGEFFAVFRNTVIGTLVQDLSEGADLEQAVRSFESKVAPTNYKRTSSLITKGMAQAAMKTIAELGIEASLQRRFATLSDLSINNIIWADNSAKQNLQGGVAEILSGVVSSTPVKVKDPTPISIDEFLNQVLPKAKAVSVMLKSEQVPNLVSLTAPAVPEAPPVFKWHNSFGWSYNGNLADSIKDKVKKAGGNVTNAKLRVSLAWFNRDDLDIHVTEPNGNHIYFGNKCGKLDVDMNAGSGATREPVENVSWAIPSDGVYDVWVHQFNRRETTDVGFVIEVENNGSLMQLSYKKPVSGNVRAAKLYLKGGVVTKIEPGDGLVTGGISQDIWGVKTETFVKVKTVLNSPNYWDGQPVGNKHLFLILEGCKNPEPTRGIYNEFLQPELDKHRKVFEILGEKTKCPVTEEEQLSGVGFSSTKKDNFVVYVEGTERRAYNVQL